MMTKEQINIFEKNHAQLESLHEELSALSKKSSKDALNKFKLKFVNKIIGESNNILGDSYLPFNDFMQFDEEEMPTNSDVIMILGQYLNCLEKLRADNIKNDYGTWYWVTKEGMSDIRTAPPKKIINK